MEGSHIDELSRVLGHYNLGTLRSARRIERGFVNQNWTLDTTSGRFFFKKRHPILCQPDIVRAQHALVQTIRRAGFPAPVILPTLTGDTFVVLDEDCYEIQEYIHGSFYDNSTRTHMRQAARTLARYHFCVTSFAPPSPLRRKALYTADTVKTVAIALFSGWAAHGHAELAPLAGRIEEHVASLEDHLRGYADLPHLVIHGDYYADNLLFDRDQIVGVVDYDKACWEPRVVELAEALIYFASPRPSQLSHLVYPGPLEWENLSLFLGNYTGNLSTAEATMLPHLIRSIWVKVSLRRLLADHPHRPRQAAAALEEVLTLADWAEANAPRVQEQAAKTREELV